MISLPNGINYTVVDRPILDSMITGNHDISKACVSHVTEIDFLFYTVSSSNYNPNISKWDVSNVTNIAGIFYNKDYFNSGIGVGCQFSNQYELYVLWRRSFQSRYWPMGR